MRYIFTTTIIAASLIACTSNEEKPDTSSATPHDAHASTTTATVTDNTPLPEIPSNARIFFVNLKDGQTVTSPLKVEMGVEGLKVDTANGILKPASGHHHILVDVDSIGTGIIVPPTDSLRHYHFGKAQTSGEIKLSPGKHTIVLQFADARHRSFGTRLLSKITVYVKK